MKFSGENIPALLDRMDSITLPEMKAIRLMNRVDTKYMAAEKDLAGMLELARGGYRVQKIGDSRIASYETIYYDTPGADMYLSHHNRKLNRQKIRTRNYVDSGAAFLEIKNKNNRGRTRKVRIPIPAGDVRGFTANPEACDFIYNRSDYPLTGLSPHVRTVFDRITLVNGAKTERLTIDTGLVFENLRTGETAGLPGLAIIELKQDGLAPSAMKTILRKLRIPPGKVSKYCIGTALTDHTVKRNRFKGKINYINKLTRL